MKKSASSARITRIRPSAPTPKRLSHSAATSRSDNEISPSGSSIITKSLPVPWYLPSFSSAIQILRQAVRDRTRSLRAGLEPFDSRIPPEPRELTPGQRLRPLHRSRDRILERKLAPDVKRHLSVPDGLARSEPAAETTVDQAAHFVEEPGVEHRPDPAFDSRGKGLRLHRDPGGADVALGVRFPRSRVRGEGPAGHRRHL